LLTVEAIRKSGLSIAGWVANHVEKDFSFAEKNITTLKEYFNDFPFLGSVYYQTNLNNKLHQHHLNKKTLIEKLRIKK